MRTYIPVEIKFIKNKEKLRKEAEKVFEFLRELDIDSRPIIISRNVLEIEGNYIVIPAHIFLLSF